MKLGNAGAGSWAALGKMLQDQLLKDTKAPTPGAGDVQAPDQTSTAQKAKTAEPVKDTFVASDSKTAGRVRSMGLDNIKNAKDAVALLAPQYADAVASLQAARKQAVTSDGTLRSAQLTTQMFGSVSKFVNEGLNNAKATDALGKLMVDAADGGRVSTEGKIRGGDLEKLDGIEAKLDDSFGAQQTHQQAATQFGHEATAAAGAEHLLESFGIAPRINTSGAMDRLRGELDGLEMFDAKVADLSKAGPPPPEMQSMINQARSSLGQRILGAQAGLLVERRKSGLLDQAIDAMKDGGKMSPGLQSMLVEGARDIQDLQATSERSKNISTNNVVAVFNLRVADIKPNLGDAKVHAKPSGVDEPAAKSSAKASAQTEGPKAQKTSQAGGESAKASAKEEPNPAQADQEPPQFGSSLNNFLFGSAGLLTGLTNVVGSVFGPEAKAKGEATLRHVEAFATEVQTAFSGDNAGEALGNIAKSAFQNAMTKLEDVLDQQRQAEADAEGMKMSGKEPRQKTSPGGVGG